MKATAGPSHIYLQYLPYFGYIFTVAVFAYKCGLCKTKQLFLLNDLQDNASWNALYMERGLLHLNINIVYSKVLQALSQ